MAEKEKLGEGAEAEKPEAVESVDKLGSPAKSVEMPSAEPAADAAPTKGEGSGDVEASEEPEPEPAGPMLLESPFRPENHRCFRVKIDDHPEVAVNAVDESEAIRTVKERLNIDGIKQAVVSIVKEVAIKSLKELLARFVL